VLAVRSLRSRLILGSALIAIVPLALAMVLLSRRIESAVREQAADRLSVTLGGLQARLSTDGQRMSEQLRILARDPQLRRLYLVNQPGSRELSDYLAEHRFLLRLDFLEVLDPRGISVGADTDSARAETVVAGGADSTGLAISRREGDQGLALRAEAPIPYEGELAGRLRGGVVLDHEFLTRLEQASGVDLILRDERGRSVATTLPAERDSARGYLTSSLPLVQGVPQPSIVGLVSTAEADRTVAELQWASLILGLIGLALAVILGVLWSSQVSRPVERLAKFSDQLAHGQWDEPLKLESVRELETLVESLDRMRRDLAAYRERLIVSERHAAWSQMARKVAHEVKNPLTPIAISIADLKRSYELGRPEFPQVLDQAVRTIGEEVETLKRLLQEFSDFARFPAPTFASCRVQDVLAGLEALYAHDVGAGRLAFQAPAADVTIRADAAQLKQALVNLVKNGLEAIDGNGRVEVRAREADDEVELAVTDTGAGLSDEQRAHLFVPGFTTKSFGSGLGLTIVERVVNEHDGTVAVESAPGKGTTFRIRLPVAGPSRTTADLRRS
jgi:signal transduction histidine kinase